jgi:hypothetical protein
MGCITIRVITEAERVIPTLLTGVWRKAEGNKPQD